MFINGINVTPNYEDRVWLDQFFTPEFCSWSKFKSYSMPVRYWIFLCQVFTIFILCNRVYCDRIYLR